MVRASSVVQGHITLMCECFSRHYVWDEVQDHYGLPARRSQANMLPRHKIFPTAPIDTVRQVSGELVFEPMRWGFVPEWWLIARQPTNRTTFNTGAEAVATAPFFRSAFQHKRCLIPASGFYIWRQTPGGRRRYYFTSRVGPIMTFAGLWDEWRNPETDELIHSCTMIVEEAGEVVTEQHDHMPVVLKSTQIQPWLSGEMSIELLKPAGEEMLNKHPVSRGGRRLRVDDTGETSIENAALPGRGPQN